MSPSLVKTQRTASERSVDAAGTQGGEFVVCYSTLASLMLFGSERDGLVEISKKQQQQKGVWARGERSEERKRERKE